jgi:hypothetical protein
VQQGAGPTWPGPRSWPGQRGGAWGLEPVPFWSDLPCQQLQLDPHNQNKNDYLLYFVLSLARQRVHTGRSTARNKNDENAEANSVMSRLERMVEPQTQEYSKSPDYGGLLRSSKFFARPSFQTSPAERAITLGFPFPLFWCDPGFGMPPRGATTGCEFPLALDRDAIGLKKPMAREAAAGRWRSVV